MAGWILLSLLIGGLLGIAAQGLRLIVGLKKLREKTIQGQDTPPTSLDRIRLFVSLLIGFTAGMVAALALWGFDAGTLTGPDLKLRLIAIFAAAYALADLAEGLLTGYIPLDHLPDQSRSLVPLTGLEAARMAILQHEAPLKEKYDNISRLIPSYHIQGRNKVPCVDICITNNNRKDIPLYLIFRLPDNRQQRIKTRIIPNFKNARPHVGRGDSLSNEHSRLYLGTVGAVLNDAVTSQPYLLTCNHVMTGGNFDNPGDIGDSALEKRFGSFHRIGAWQFGKMDETVDAAMIAVDQAGQLSSNDINPDPYLVTEDDCSHTRVELVGAISLTRNAFIIHIDESISMDYDNQTVDIHGLITLSSGLGPFNFSPVTQKGDSGALVYHADSRRPIGIVLGANDNFTYVIPLKAVFDAFPQLTLSFA